MQGKDVVRALLWAAAVFLLWQMIAVRIWPPVPVEDQLAPLAGEPGAGDLANLDQPATRDPATSAGDGRTAQALNAVAGEPRSITIGSIAGGKESPYRMELMLNSVGAALVDAVLSDFKVTVDADSPHYPMVTEEIPPGGPAYRSFATEKLHFSDWALDVDLHDVPWTVESQSENQAVFAVVIQDGTTPVLRLRKTFTLPPQAAESSQHDLEIRYHIENLTERAITTILTHWGPVGLRREDRRFNDRRLFLGTFEDDAVAVDAFNMEPDKEIPVYSHGKSDHLLWTAVANKFFAVFESPRPEEGHSEVEWINEIRQMPISDDGEQGPTSTFRTTTQRLLIPQRGTREFVIDSYLGPKSRKAFQSVPQYVQRGYDQQVVSSYSMGPCAFMTPQSLTRFMIWMLNVLKGIVHNYGVAIIILVLIVRSLLHPITKKGQVNMMRMQQQMGTLAPKMEEIKQRFPNDKQKQSQETMKLYQREGINPATGMLSSCLPMFLQMPIWIALFTALNFNIDMRHQPFCLWINDLTSPDALIRFDHPVHIPLISSLTGPITSFNLLPILVSIAMFVQQKLMPKTTPPPGKSGQQAEQAAQMQKMMPYMTLVFGLFFYNMPSGLNLYIGASSFFGAIEQQRIRKHIEELKKQPPPVKGGNERLPKKTKKSKGPSLFERLKKAAEEAEKVKSKRPKAKKRV